MFVEVDSPAEKIETTFTETITEQTTPQRGAEWLDSEVPGWADKIDLDNFDLSSCEFCVCGYVFMDDAAEQNEKNLLNADDDWFDDDADPMNGYDYFLFTFNESPTYFGFQANDLYEYTGLEKEWRELIAVRQS